MTFLKKPYGHSEFHILVLRYFPSNSSHGKRNLG